MLALLTPTRQAINLSCCYFPAYCINRDWTFPESPEVDLIYQVLKQAGEISNSKTRVNLEPPVGITVDRGATSSAPGSSGSSGQSLNRRSGAPAQPSRAQGSNLAVINPAPCSTSSGLFQLRQCSVLYFFCCMPVD